MRCAMRRSGVAAIDMSYETRRSVPAQVVMIRTWAGALAKTPMPTAMLVMLNY